MYPRKYTVLCSRLLIYLHISERAMMTAITCFHDFGNLLFILLQASPVYRATYYIIEVVYYYYFFSPAEATWYFRLYTVDNTFHRVYYKPERVYC